MSLILKPEVYDEKVSDPSTFNFAMAVGYSEPFSSDIFVANTTLTRESFALCFDDAYEGGLTQDDCRKRSLRYCPDCMESGFHTALFQATEVERCPWHGTRLKTRSQYTSEAVPLRVPATVIRQPFECESGQILWPDLVNCEKWNQGPTPDERRELDSIYQYIKRSTEGFWIPVGKGKWIIGGGHTISNGWDPLFHEYGDMPEVMQRVSRLPDEFYSLKVNATLEVLPTQPRRNLEQFQEWWRGKDASIRWLRRSPRGRLFLTHFFEPALSKIHQFFIDLKARIERTHNRCINGMSNPKTCTWQVQSVDLCVWQAAFVVLRNVNKFNVQRVERSNKEEFTLEGSFPLEILAGPLDELSCTHTGLR